PPAMDDKIKWLLAIALLLGGWIAGFMMGDHTAPSTLPPPQHTQRDESASPLAARTSAPTANSPLTRSELRAATREEEGKVDDLLRAAFGQTNDLRRLRDVYDAVSKMSPEEIAAALATAQQRPAKDR